MAVVREVRLWPTAEVTANKPSAYFNSPNRVPGHCILDRPSSIKEFGAKWLDGMGQSAYGVYADQTVW